MPKPRVIILLGGGMIETVYSDQEIDMDIIDLDDPSTKEREYARMEEANNDPRLKYQY